MRFLSKQGASVSVLALLCSTAAAHAELPLAGIIAQGRPVIDLRARYETVTDNSKTLDANANTIRARLGYDTGYWNNFQLGFDFDQIWTVGGATYNSTRNGKTAYPTIADPSMTVLNRLTLILAPVALGCVLLYSFTKRWTQFSHLVLGACLSIAPTGAWIAVRGEIGSPVPLLLSLVVLLWTAGFDVLYACQDYDFDRSEGLKSIPARFGVARALWIARGLHAAAFLALVWLFVITRLGPVAFAGVIATGALLVYQHRLVRAGDLSRLNAAFFTTNAFVSVILLATFGSAVFLNRQ